jgi:mannose-6-phosphate isomerase-like protein (cupin superfamily)
MDMLHLSQLEDLPWQPHPTIAGVLTKVFEGCAQNPLADALLAQVAPQGTIPWHVHEKASETAYIVAGNGVLLYAPDAEHLQPLEAVVSVGCAFTVQAGVWHSVQNREREPLILFAFHTPPTL